MVAVSVHHVVSRTVSQFFYLSFGDLYLNWCRTILNEVIRPEVILCGGQEAEIRERTNLHDYPVFKVNGFGKCGYKGIHLTADGN